MYSYFFIIILFSVFFSLSLSLVSVVYLPYLFTCESCCVIYLLLFWEVVGEEGEEEEVRPLGRVYKVLEERERERETKRDKESERKNPQKI